MRAGWDAAQGVLPTACTQKRCAKGSAWCRFACDDCSVMHARAGARTAEGQHWQEALVSVSQVLPKSNIQFGAVCADTRGPGCAWIQLHYATALLPSCLLTLIKSRGSASLRKTQDSEMPATLTSQIRMQGGERWVEGNELCTGLSGLHRSCRKADSIIGNVYSALSAVRRVYLPPLPPFPL